MASPVLDKNGLIYLWQKIVALIDSKLNGDEGEPYLKDTLTDIITNADGSKTVTETLFNGDKIVTTLPNSSPDDYLRTIVEKKIPKTGNTVKVKTTEIINYSPTQKIISESHTVEQKT